MGTGLPSVWIQTRSIFCLKDTACLVCVCAKRKGGCLLQIHMVFILTGMHEVLAPLVYVLHSDVTHLLQVRQRYQDPFEDTFDTPHEDISFSFKEEKCNVTSLSRSALHVPSENALSGDNDWVKRVHSDDLSLVEPDDFGFNLKTVVLGSDSYGAEGELGALLSKRFIEHDAFCMFDSLMRGHRVEVVLADFFSAVNDASTGLSPVLDASAGIYRSLASVDMPLYIHLVGLGVEPQYFTLRWLRVLFGREFDLDSLLLLWDAIFNASNSSKKSVGSIGALKSSARGLFITNFAVSMILYLRPTLLAASNATTCLQKLLNFPKNADVRALIENSNMLRSHLDELSKTAPSLGSKHLWPSVSNSGNSRQISCSPSFRAQIFSSRKGLQQGLSPSAETIWPSIQESYWEERWMNLVLPKEQLEDLGTPEESISCIDSELTNEPARLHPPKEMLLKANSSNLEAENEHLIKEPDLDVTGEMMDHGNSSKGRMATGTCVNNLVNNADRSQDISLNKGDTCSEKTEILSTNPDSRLFVSLERDTVGTETPEHVCIHALDLSAGRGMSNSSHENVCSCSSCKSDSSEDLQQRGPRRYCSDDISLRRIKGVAEGLQPEEAPKMEGDAKALKDEDLRISLQAFGRAMVQSIEVLENALSSLCADDEGTVTLVQSTHSTHKGSLSTEGRSAAIRALTDLRKISNILLQI
ncbi:hypothetical protein KP509_04G023700 [Ceratopteris richardii]|uniref:Rab-GAP TBC domain-containing protein n=1 Tax=Ceratopteris richardii TaxID=49495 RepID=A0A8T2UVB5_CERRI|nr:hypothetical protein KP509_04G023700 [Ceratopteris richardii]KAH7438641.1 hypothetical protein KP509_04G023700 [Ceratopteris richardii]KAH7438643.1 hypothetical protein KP509_04G023700 [Ceratopteris richardii]